VEIVIIQIGNQRRICIVSWIESGLKIKQESKFYRAFH